MLLSIDKIEEIHHLLNDIYTTADNDFTDLKKHGTECKLILTDKNYIKLHDQYKLQHYPIPIIEIKDFWDIGYNLDYIFFECSLRRDDAKNLNLNIIFEKFKNVEIYGGKDCLKDFYNKGDTAETVIRRIEQSDEDIIMLSLYFEYGVESTYELYKKSNRIIRSACTP